MIWSLLWLVLQVIAATQHGAVAAGPTYAMASWPCTLDWDCYVIVSWADAGLPPLLSYETGAESSNGQ